ncbi:MAG TPA: hypothetical protein VHO02_06685 [Fibrobacteria bacterium]|jgi:hypothetical protein|nr:hypothetical protein [Fibrobacteria bacterium]
MKTKIAFLAALVFLPALAFSQPGDDYKERNYTLTIQPVLLAVPIGVVMYETRLTEAVGVAVFGGYGQFTYKRDGEDVDAVVYGAGMQTRFYAFDRHTDSRARFGEPHLGIQAMWAHGEGEEEDQGFFDTFGDDVWGRGEQFMAGPFIGYKYVAPFGLTAEIQLGAQAGARYSYGGEGNTGTDDDPKWEFKWMPIGNLGVGWSF